jgi:hypothetical protein
LVIVSHVSLSFISCLPGVRFTKKVMDTQTLSPESQNQKWGFFSTLIWSLVIWALMAGSQLLTIQMIYGDISKEIINEVKDNNSTFCLCVFVAILIGILIMCGIIKLKKNSNIKEYITINRISLKQIRESLSGG